MCVEQTEQLKWERYVTALKGPALNSELKKRGLPQSKDRDTSVSSKRRRLLEVLKAGEEAAVPLLASRP